MTTVDTPVATVIESETEKLLNRQAEAISGRPYLSWSQISTFRSCPRKFAFQYVECARPDFVPSNLLFGGAVHAALECHFRGLLEGDTPDLAGLLEAYRQCWREDRAEPDAPLKFGKGEDETVLASLADRMLTAFLASPAARPVGRILAVEETVTGTVCEDLPDFLARVDLVLADDQELRLLDAKTARSRWTAAKAAQSADQLLLYRVLAGHMAEAHETMRLGFLVVTKAASPAVQELDVIIADARQDRLVDCLTSVWRAMRAGVDYVNPSPMSCPGCPFQSRCPAVAGAG